MSRHRHHKPNHVDAQLPADHDVHVIMDNYGTHKAPKVIRWFVRHPRYHLHFTPTSASWLNQVERFFSTITTQRIRRGTFQSVPALEAAIHEYLAHYNEHCAPFVGPRPPTSSWTRAADFVNELRGRDTEEIVTCRLEVCLVAHSPVTNSFVVDCTSSVRHTSRQTAQL